MIIRLPKRPVLTILFWSLLSVSLALIGVWLGTRTTLPGPSSEEAIARSAGEVAASKAGLPSTDTFLVILEHQTLPIESEQFLVAREDLHAYLKDLTCEGGVPLFRAVQTPGHTWLPIEPFIGADGRSVLFLAETTVARSQASIASRHVPALLESWSERNSAFRLHYLSNGTADNEMFNLIGSDLDRSLLITLPLTLVILLWTFGSLIAALIPLVVALVSLGASLGLVAVTSHLLAPVSATAAQLVVLLVLAIGIDYSLFYVSRMREELAKGLSQPDALLATVRGVSPAIAWSGLTVAVSLSGLLLVRDTVLSSMALVSLASVGITVIGTILVVPSILSLIKTRYVAKSPTGRPDSGLVARLLNFSLGRPVIVLVSCLLALSYLSSFCLSMHLGSTVEPERLPMSMQSAVAYRALERSFPALAGPDFAVVLVGERLSSLEEDGLLQPFVDEVRSLDTVTGPLATETSVDGKIMRLRWRARGSSNEAQNVQVVHHIEEVLVPKFLSPLGISASMSGTLPFAVREVEEYSSKFPIVLAAILALSFVFLLIAFRSIVISLKAILLNLLSTGASFGALVFIFQGGHTSWSYGVIESFVPPLLFSILFGLSMDYHVFLLSRITEERRTGRSPKDAIWNGTRATAQTITSAALIMVAVFATIASLQLPVMKQLGTGLAIAVLLDATIVRTLLLPAAMLLLGESNWYLPKWLGWLPKVRAH